MYPVEKEPALFTQGGIRIGVDERNPPSAADAREVGREASVQRFQMPRVVCLLQGRAGAVEGFEKLELFSRPSLVDPARRGLETEDEARLAAQAQCDGGEIDLDLPDHRRIAALESG